MATKKKATKKTTKRTPKKATAKKATAKKKATKKKTTTKAATNGKAPKKAEYGIEKSNDLPWNEKKVAVFKALKALKAVGDTNAKSAKQVAEKAGVTPRDVRHYCYHAKVSGLTGVATSEDFRGYGFYLTKTGSKVDPVKAHKEQEAAKWARLVTS